MASVFHVLYALLGVCIKQYREEGAWYLEII